MRIKKPVWGPWLIDGYWNDGYEIHLDLVNLQSGEHYPHRLFLKEWLELRPTLAEATFELVEYNGGE